MTYKSVTWGHLMLRIQLFLIGLTNPMHTCALLPVNSWCCFSCVCLVFLVETLPAPPTLLLLHPLVCVKPP